MFKKMILFAFVLSAMTSALAVEDKVILDPKKEGRWRADILEDHPVWNRAACVSYIENDEGASLEVVAFLSGDGVTWTRPVVHIISPVDSVFTDVSFTIDRILENKKLKKFEAIEVLSEDGESIAGRSLFDDAELLLKSLRQRNVVTVTYTDVEGTVEKTTFRLRGSSNAISAQVRECGLKTNPLPSLEPLTELQ